MKLTIKEQEMIWIIIKNYDICPEFWDEPQYNLVKKLQKKIFTSMNSHGFSIDSIHLLPTYKSMIRKVRR